jgi:hypothetical protein
MPYSRFKYIRFGVSRSRYDDLRRDPESKSPCRVYTWRGECQFTVSQDTAGEPSLSATLDFLESFLVH